MVEHEFGHGFVPEFDLNHDAGAFARQSYGIAQHLDL
jgi:hypothetical protein